MAHEQALKKIELNHALSVKQLDVYYKEKKDSFSQFAKAAGSLIFDTSTKKLSLNDLESSAANALLFCSAENKNRILDFLKFASSYIVAPFSEENRNEFSEKLTGLSFHLNEELKSTVNYNT